MGLHRSSDTVVPFEAVFSEGPPVLLWIVVSAFFCAVKFQGRSQSFGEVACMPQKHPTPRSLQPMVSLGYDVLGAVNRFICFLFPRVCARRLRHSQGQNSFVDRNLKSLFEFSMVPQQAAAARLDWAIMVTVDGSARSSLLDAGKDTGPSLLYTLPAGLYPS